MRAWFDQGSIGSVAAARAACISTSARASASASGSTASAAWRALQRRAVTLGQLQCADAQGLSLARQFAMLSYRTPEEFGERFDSAPEIVNGRVRVAAEDYLDAAGAQYVARTASEVVNERDAVG